MSENKIITISRQFGSGGHDVGKLLSQKLGLSFYDKDLIVMAAEKSGMSRELLENLDETMSLSFFQPFSAGGRFSILNDVSINDKVFFEQAAVIKSLADKESCIIVGRCADYVLRHYTNVFNIYVFANLDYRIGRVKDRYQLEDAAAKDVVIKTDKRRSSYYNYYSGKSWGAANSYHLCVDSGFSGVEKTVDTIAKYVLG